MPENQSSVNVAGLQTLYQSEEPARVILDHLAARERNRRITTVDRLVSVLQTQERSLSRGDVISVCRATEELGCGSFVAGRRGYQSRFEWGVQMVSAAQCRGGRANRRRADDER